MARANLKPRLRMSALYYIASSRNYLVTGRKQGMRPSSAFSPNMVTAGGHQALGELYKRDIRELARLLGVPQPIIASPLSWPVAGQTDEGEMGVTYARSMRPGMRGTPVASRTAGRASGQD